MLLALVVWDTKHKLSSLGFFTRLRRARRVDFKLINCEKKKEGGGEGNRHPSMQFYCMPDLGHPPASPPVETPPTFAYFLAGGENFPPPSPSSLYEFLGPGE